MWLVFKKIKGNMEKIIVLRDRNEGATGEERVVEVINRIDYLIIQGKEKKARTESRENDIYLQDKPANEMKVWSDRQDKNQ